MIHISFEEAVFGCEKEIELMLKDPCTECGGTGAKKGHPLRKRVPNAMDPAR